MRQRPVLVAAIVGSAVLPAAGGLEVHVGDADQ
jgi:hypothetical protein